MRSTVQPFRRNSALYRVYDDLILYLKTELNFQDLSYYYQEVIEPSGLNLNIVPADPSDSNPATHGGRYVPLPIYDTDHKTHSLISLHKTNVASVFFSGEAPDENGNMMSGQSIPVSGTGVYTTGPELDSASLFNLKDDFCIEFWAKFSGVPDSVSGSYLFDFGNLKFANYSGFFSIEAPDSNEKYFDWYDVDFRTDVGAPIEFGPDGGPTMTNRFTHYAVQRRNDNIELWVGPQKDDNTTGPFFKVLEAPLHDEDGNKYFLSGNAEEPFNNVRTFGSTISGTHPYTGWMDEIKVWKRSIYEGPVVIAPNLSCSGIYVNPVPASDLSVAGRISMLTEPFVYDYGPHLITANHDALLFVQVDSRYDPRYSVNVPLPVEVRWYKELISDSTMIATSKDSTMVQGNIIDQKMLVGADGLYTLKIKNFAKDDEGVYRVVIAWGDSARPVNIQECKPVLLRFRQPPPPPCHAKDTDILMHNKVSKKIQDLSHGDWVMGFDKDDNLVKNGVRECEEKLAQSYYKLKINDVITKVTGGHPYYIGNGKYEEARNLKIGDIVYLYEKGKLIGIPVQDKEHIEKEMAVYTLSVGGTKNYFANEIAVHNKSPIPKPYMVTAGCGVRVNPGDDAQVCATLLGLNQWSYTSPITWTWNIGGIVQTIPDIEAPWDPPSSAIYAQSCRTLLNLKRNTGPFTIDATDANGQTWSTTCWGVYVSYPVLQCPAITDMLPNVDKPDDYTVYPQGAVASGYNWTTHCRQFRFLSIKPDQTTIDIEFEVLANDPNIADLNTGGLRYEWWNGNYDTQTGTSQHGNQWVQGTNKRTFTLASSPGSYAGAYHGGQFTAVCRICYNNYPAAGGPNPNGLQQKACTHAYFKVGYPKCKEPWVQYAGIFGGNLQAWYHKHRTGVRPSSGVYRPITGGWNSRQQAYYGRSMSAETSIRGNQWGGNTDTTVNVWSCSEDTDVIMYVLADRKNPKFNYVMYGNANCGSTSSHWGAYGLVWGGGYVNDDGVRPMKLPGKGHTGVIVRQGGPNASNNPATFKWMLYERDHQCFQPHMDKLIVTKDAYAKDNGSWVELDFLNECGITKQRINYRVYQETAPWLTFAYWNQWYFGRVARNNTTMIFYRYLHIFSQGRINTRTGATANYAIYWHPQSGRITFSFGPKSACMMWRAKLNGVNLEAGAPFNPAPATPQGFYHLGGGSKCGLHSMPTSFSSTGQPQGGVLLAACGTYATHFDILRKRPGLRLSFSHPHQGQSFGYILVDAKAAWDSIGVNGSLWKSGSNTLEITLCNNPPDGNPANITKGNCVTKTVTIVLDDAPIIISPINSPFSGQFNNRSQTWWNRWWWPWYNPWFTGGVIRGLLRGRNGWWRWTSATQRPGGSGQNGTRISLRTFAAIQGVTIP